MKLLRWITTPACILYRISSLWQGGLVRKDRGHFYKRTKGSLCVGISTYGDGKMRTYSLSKRYESGMALITKAVEIGLTEMSEQTKVQKKGHKILWELPPLLCDGSSIILRNGILILMLKNLLSAHKVAVIRAPDSCRIGHTLLLPFYLLWCQHRYPPYHCL